MRRLASVLAGFLALAAGAAEAGLPPVGPADAVLGPETAPVTVIEYASLTCPHCGHWAVEVFPRVRQDWLDTGKIRFVFRDFPLDRAALQAAVIAHCADGLQYWDILHAEFANQRDWAEREADPTGKLLELAKGAGLPVAKARACLTDDGLRRRIVASATGGEEAGVDSTPTFFFNGKKIVGEISYGEFTKRLREAGAGP